jgi:hypothetical protein
MPLRACIARGLLFLSLAVSDGLESTFSGLKKKKKKAVSSHDIYCESNMYVSECVCVCVFTCCHQQ